MSARSWRTLYPGTNDRCVVTTVNVVLGPSITATIAARGSSGTRSHVGFGSPGTRRGNDQGAASNLWVRHSSTGSRETRAMP